MSASRQVNSNLPCKFGLFWKKLNFWAPKTPLLDGRGAQTLYGVIWNFTAIIYLSTLRIFYVKMVTYEGLGRGLHILSCDRAKSIDICIYLHWKCLFET